MKLSRVLVLAALAASIGSAASAQRVYHWGPQEIGYQYTYYSDFSHTGLVSVNAMACNGTETWDGYNGNPDLSISEYYDYVEWQC